MAQSGYIARRAMICGVAQALPIWPRTAEAVPPRTPVARSEGVDFEFPQESSIICRAQVNGVPVHGLIDTGSTSTVIDTALAQRLGMTGSAQVTYAGGVGSIQMLRLKEAELQFGGGRLSVTSPVCADLAPLSGPHGEGPDLIIGLDALRQIGLYLNFSQRRLLVRPSAAAPRFGQILPVRNGEWGEASVRVIANGLVLQAMLDTGNANAVVASPGAGQKLCGATTRVSDALAVGADGLVDEIVFSMGELRLGSSRLKDVPVGALPAWRASVPLFIGLPTLSQFEVSLDLGADLISIRPDHARQQRGFLHDLSGLGLKQAPDRLEVVHIAKGGPGEDAGMTVGDAIMAVDGHPVDQGYSKGDMWRWRFRSLPTGASLTLADGRVKRIDLHRYY